MQVGEEPPPLSDHLKQAAPTGIVVAGCSEMFGQMLDALREDCDLDLRRTGVFVVAPVGLDDLTLGCRRSGRHPLSFL
jgi:hypothetical protein